MEEVTSESINRQDSIYCETLKRRLLGAEKMLHSNNILIKILKDQLKEMEKRQLNTLDAKEKIRFKCCSVEQDYIKFRNLCQKLHEENKKLLLKRNQECKGSQKFEVLQKEITEWKIRYKELEQKFTEDETNRCNQIIVTNTCLESCSVKTFYKIEKSNLETLINQQNQVLKDFLARIFMQMDDVVSAHTSENSQLMLPGIKLDQECVCKLDDNEYLAQIIDENKKLKQEIKEMSSSICSCKSAYHNEVQIQCHNYDDCTKSTDTYIVSEIIHSNKNESSISTNCEGCKKLKLNIKEYADVITQLESVVEVLENSIKKINNTIDIKETSVPEINLDSDYKFILKDLSDLVTFIINDKENNKLEIAQLNLEITECKVKLEASKTVEIVKEEEILKLNRELNDVGKLLEKIQNECSKNCKTLKDREEKCESLKKENLELLESQRSLKQENKNLLLELEEQKKYYENCKNTMEKETSQLQSENKMLKNILDTTISESKTNYEMIFKLREKIESHCKERSECEENYVLEIKGLKENLVCEKDCRIDCENKNNELKENLVQLQSERDEMCCQIFQLKDCHYSLENEINKLNQSFEREKILNSELENLNKSFDKEINDLRSENTYFKYKISELNTIIEDLKEELNIVNEKNTKLETIILELNKKIDEKDKDMSLIEQNETLLEEKYNVCKLQITEAKCTIKKLEQAVQDASDKDKIIKELETQIKEHKQNCSKQCEVISELKQSLQDASDKDKTIIELEKQIERQKRNNNKQSEAISKFEQTLQDASEKNNGLEKQIQEQKQHSSIQDEIISKLKQDLQDASDKDKAINELERQVETQKQTNEEQSKAIFELEQALQDASDKNNTINELEKQIKKQEQINSEQNKTIAKVEQALQDALDKDKIIASKLENQIEQLKLKYNNSDNNNNKLKSEYNALLEKHKVLLEKQEQHENEIIKLQDTILTLKNEKQLQDEEFLLFDKKCDINEIIQNYVSKITNIQTENDELKKNIELLTNQIKEKEEDNKKLNAKTKETKWQKIETNLTKCECSKKIVEVQEKNRILQQEVECLKKDISTKKSLINDLTQCVNECRLVIDNCNDEINETKENNKKLTEELENIKVEKNKLIENVETLTKEKENHSTQNNTLNEQANNFERNSQQAVHETKKDDFESEMRNIQKNMYDESLEKKYNNLKVEFEEQDKYYQQLVNELRKEIHSCCAACNCDISSILQNEKKLIENCKSKMKNKEAKVIQFQNIIDSEALKIQHLKYFICSLHCENNHLKKYINNLISKMESKIKELDTSVSDEIKVGHKVLEILPILEHKCCNTDCDCMSIIRTSFSQTIINKSSNAIKPEEEQEHETKSNVDSNINEEDITLEEARNIIENCVCEITFVNENISEISIKGQDNKEEEIVNVNKPTLSREPSKASKQISANSSEIRKRIDICINAEKKNSVRCSSINSSQRSNSSVVGVLKPITFSCPSRDFRNYSGPKKIQNQNLDTSLKIRSRTGSSGSRSSLRDNERKNVCGGCSKRQSSSLDPQNRRQKPFR